MTTTPSISQALVTFNRSLFVYTGWLMPSAMWCQHRQQ
ncbi:hypothetical protein M8C21_023176 [Ambrosia artemisiifolia]|uniref:Uncharacterized protein n=1 Tax=Ambrosia artemisiifolia TaxID=4212 RepID=A0AAD5G5Q7_AMBAR|nr:hypothetical protein M8C21_023176 [Ambrosia artemisiifolia]